MTNNTEPVLGWKVGGFDNFQPTNKEVCEAFWIRCPDYLDEDETDLFERFLTDHFEDGENDKFSAFCYVVSKNQEIEPDECFANNNEANNYTYGWWSAVEELGCGGSDLTRFVYWDTTAKDNYNFLAEPFLDTMDNVRKDKNACVDPEDWEWLEDFMKGFDL